MDDELDAVLRGADLRDVPIFGTQSDTARGDDQLGLELEIDALSALVASRETRTPLSVGLFGNWGSGKSFFMQKMDERIRRFRDSAQHEPSAPYHANVVQIWFNAWHYIDQSLWATLGASIFEGLAHGMTELQAQKADRATVEDARTKLQVERVAARADSDAARKAVEGSSLLLEQRQGELARVQSNDQDLESLLGTKAVIGDIWTVAADQSEVKRTLEQAAKELGFPELRESDAGVQVEAILRAASFWRSAWHQGKNLTISSGLVALAVLGIAFLVQYVTPIHHHLTDAWRWLLSGLAGLMAALGPVLTTARRLANLAEQARTELSFRVGEQRAAAEKQAKEAQAEAEKALKAARDTLSERDQRLRNIETALEALNPSRQIVSFIQERNESDEYTRHFGVIARARRDFEELTRLMQLVTTQRTASGDEASGFRPIDRIVLYIDDLDRCPEAKVFEVLQGVHLLLAFPLFVVVVGVDQRWLLHSLQSELLRGLPSDGSGGRAGPAPSPSMPLNYLEKIFQIPFALRPMDRTGFERLIDDMTQGADTNGKGAPSAPTPSPSLGTDGRVRPSPGAGVSSQAAVPRRGSEALQATEADESGSVAESGIRRSLESHERLELERWERAHLKKFFELMPSPRAAKRYVNVYRLLRGISTRRRELIGDETAGGYRPALLLLALTTGYPAEAAVLLGQLSRRMREPSGATGWWESIELVRAEAMTAARPPTPNVNAERYREMLDKLAAVRRHMGEEPLAAREVLAWAPHVARFSFAATGELDSAEESGTRPARASARAAE